MSMNSGHVYLIDSHTQRRDGLASVLTSQRYALSTFEDVPSFLNRVDYDALPLGACVLTQLNLTPLTGIDLLDIFRADDVALPVILMAAESELTLTVKAVRYSGVYILWQPFSASQLLETLAHMLREWSSDPAVSTSHAFARRFASLSPRQRQVLQYIFEGNGNRSIAKALGLSVKTVELHRASMMKKMRADSVIDLVKTMTRFQHAVGDRK